MRIFCCSNEKDALFTDVYGVCASFFALIVRVHTEKSEFVVLENVFCKLYELFAYPEGLDDLEI